MYRTVVSDVRLSSRVKPTSTDMSRNTVGYVTSVTFAYANLFSVLFCVPKHILFYILVKKNIRWGFFIIIFP